MTFYEFCELCQLEIIVTRKTGCDGLWIAKFTSKSKYQGAGSCPDTALIELCKAVQGVAFKDFPEVMDFAVVPVFTQSNQEY